MPGEAPGLGEALVAQGAPSMTRAWAFAGCAAVLAGRCPWP